MEQYSCVSWLPPPPDPHTSTKTRGNGRMPRVWPRYGDARSRLAANASPSDSHREGALSPSSPAGSARGGDGTHNSPGNNPFVSPAGAPSGTPSTESSSAAANRVRRSPGSLSPATSDRGGSGGRRGTPTASLPQRDPVTRKRLWPKLGGYEPIKVPASSRFLSSDSDSDDDNFRSALHQRSRTQSPPPRKPAYTPPNKSVGFDLEESLGRGKRREADAKVKEDVENIMTAKMENTLRELDAVRLAEKAAAERREAEQRKWEANARDEEEERMRRKQEARLKEEEDRRYRDRMAQEDAARRDEHETRERQEREARARAEAERWERERIAREEEYRREKEREAEAERWERERIAREEEYRREKEREAKAAQEAERWKKEEERRERERQEAARKQKEIEAKEREVWEALEREKTRNVQLLQKERELFEKEKAKMEEERRKLEEKLREKERAEQRLKESLLLPEKARERELAEAQRSIEINNVPKQQTVTTRATSEDDQEQSGWRTAAAGPIDMQGQNGRATPLSRENGLKQKKKIASKTNDTDSNSSNSLGVQSMLSFTLGSQGLTVLFCTTLLVSMSTCALHCLIPEALPESSCGVLLPFRKMHDGYWPVIGHWLLLNTQVLVTFDPEDLIFVNALLMSIAMAILSVLFLGAESQDWLLGPTTLPRDVLGALQVLMLLLWGAAGSSADKGKGSPGELFVALLSGGVGAWMALEAGRRLA